MIIIKKLLLVMILILVGCNSVDYEFEIAEENGKLVINVEDKYDNYLYNGRETIEVESGLVLPDGDYKFTAYQEKEDRCIIVYKTEFKIENGKKSR